jgi:hypothetical protein
MSLQLPDPKVPYLYILMRSDLDSLNPGKMVAQGAHAANQFTHEMDNLVAMSGKDNHLYNQWKTSTPDGFGVTICLDVTGYQLPLVVNLAKQAGIAAGVTHDPSYPLLDGKVLHSLPLDTCGYVFGDKSDLRILLGQFDLLK